MGGLATMGRLATVLLGLAVATGAQASVACESTARESVARATGQRAAHEPPLPLIAREPSVGRRIAREASRFVGADSLAIARDDCSGFVELVYRRAHVPLAGSSQELRRIAARRHALRFHRARPGDLVFFRDTIEGRRGITHVGIVDSIAPDGASTFVHRSGTGVVRSRLDLRRPHTARDARGRLRNDILRRAGRGARARLSGELFAGFASADRLARAR